MNKPVITAPQPIQKTNVVFRMPAYQLLCMLTWKGIAYTTEFERVFNMLVDHIHQNRAIIEVIDSSKFHSQSETSGRTSNVPSPVTMMRNDPTVMKEIENHLGIPIKDGSRIKPDTALISRMRRAFKNKSIRSTCISCGFNDMCTREADSGFKRAHINFDKQKP